MLTFDDYRRLVREHEINLTPAPTKQAQRNQFRTYQDNREISTLGDRLNDWENRVGTLYSTMNNYYNTAKNKWTAPDSIGASKQSYDKQYADLSAEAEVLKKIIEKGRKAYGDDVSDNRLNNINNILDAYANGSEGWQQLQQYWSNWDSAEAYEKDKRYLSMSVQEIDDKIKALENEEASDESWFTDNGKANLKKHMQFASGASGDDLRTRAEIDAELKELREWRNANYYRALINEANSASKDSEFNTIVNKGREIAKSDYTDKVHDAEENPDTYKSYYKKNAMDKVGSEFLEVNGPYAFLTDDERNYYYYLVGNGKRAEADNFLNNLSEYLNSRIGSYVSGETNGILGNLNLAFEAGMDQFGTGINQLFTADPLPTTYLQYAAADKREDLGTLGKIGFDLVQTTTNMAPSILLSYLTSGIASGLGAGAAAGTAGKIAGSVSMGSSAAGNAFGQALKEKYPVEQALYYGILTGLSEIGLQSALGGISAFGPGKLVKKISDKAANAISNLDNALFRIAGTAGIRSLGEGFEEFLQDVLDPIFRNIALGENNGVLSGVTSDAFYSGLLGMLSSGAIETGSITVNDYISRHAQSASVDTHKVQGLIDYAKLLPDTEAYQIAQNMESGKYDINNAEHVELLVNAINSELEKSHKNINKKVRVAGEKVVSDLINAASVSEETHNPAATTSTAEYNGSQIEIEGVSKNTKNGLKIDIKVADGSTETVNAALLTFSDENTKMLYDIAENYDTNGAKAFVKNYDGKMDVHTYASTFYHAYKAGFYGTETQSGILTEITQDNPNFPARTVLAAYFTGQNDAQISKIKRTKIDKEYETRKLNRESRRAIASIAKKLGVEVEYVSKQGENGIYANGKITISLDSDNPLLAVATHEFVHSFKDSAPEAYRQYQSLVIDYLKQADPAGYEARVKRLTDLYQEKSPGAKIDEAYIQEEIVANSSADMLTDRKFVESLTGQKTNIAQRILDAIEKIWMKIRGQLKTMDNSQYKNYEIDLMRKSAETFEKARDLFREMVQESSAQQNIENHNKVKYNVKGDNYDSRQENQRYDRGQENTEAGRHGRVSGQTQSSSDQGVSVPLSRVDRRKNYRGLTGVLKSALKAQGITSIDLRYHSSAESFESAIQAAKKSNPYGAYVTQYSASDYSGMDLFLSDDGNVGVALHDTEHGTDIVSVFKNPKTNVKRAVSSILITAIENGGNKLDNFHGDLSTWYEQHGFIPVARCAFNEEFAPTDWNFERDGKPDIVFWVHNGDPVSTIVENIGNYEIHDIKKLPLFYDYDEAGAYRDSFISSGNMERGPKYQLRESASPMRNLLESYGSIPKGVDPSRDIQVPQKTSDDKNVRRYVRTVLESKHITDEMIEPIQKKILDEVYSYEPVTDPDASAYAMNVIKKEGYDQALMQWKSVVYGDKIADKNSIALGQYLLKAAADAGDAKQTLMLIGEIAAEGTRAGQTVQALSMLKKMEDNNIGRLYYLRRAVDNLNRDVDMKRRIEKGKQQTLHIKESLASELLNAKTAEETETAANNILQDIANQMPADWVEKWDAWRYLAMLTNPTTHIRNLAGNAVFMPAVRFKDIIGAGMEIAAQKRGHLEERTKVFKVDKTYRDFALSDFQSIKKELSKGSKYSEKDEIKDMRAVFGNKYLETVRKFNFKLLEMEDGKFLKMYYTHALGSYLAANKVDLNTIDDTALQKARAYAFDEAQKATYRDASKIAQKLSSAAKTNAVTRVAFGGIIPFTKTPINIIKRGIEYSPLGFLEAVTRGTYQLKKGKISAAQFIDGVAAGLSGSVLFGLGMWLRSLGVLEGALGDDEEDWMKDLYGSQGYSLKLGNFSYTIDWMAPVSVPLFLGAEVMHMFEDGERPTFGEVFDVADKIVSPIFELSMLSGINDTISAIKYDNNPILGVMRETTTNYLLQAYPTILSKIARTVDGTQRRTYIDKNSNLPEVVQRFLQKARNKTVFLSKLAEPYVDQWGNTETTDNVFVRVISNFFSPGYFSTIKNDNVRPALEKLYAKTGEKGVLPGSAPKYFTVDGNRIDLSGEEYTTFATARGQSAYTIISDLIDSAEFDKLTDYQKTEVIKYAYDIANAVGKMEVSDYTPATWIREALYAEDTGRKSLLQSLLSRVKDKDEETGSNYSSFDVVHAVDTNNDIVIRQIIDDKVQNSETKDKALSSLRATITRYYKPLYQKAWLAKDTAEQKRIQLILAGLRQYGIKYTGDEMVAWKKAAKKDLES